MRDSNCEEMLPYLQKVKWLKTCQLLKNFEQKGNEMKYHWHDSKVAF